MGKGLNSLAKRQTEEENFKGFKVASSAVSSAPAARDRNGAGTKRKRGGEMKFYAVRVGFRPGIYTTYDECLSQIKGFKGAKCRFPFLRFIGFFF